MRKTIILNLIVFLALVSLVNGAIIEHHTVISNTGLDQTQSSPITQQILLYEDYFHACEELTDISVVGYFTIDSEEGDAWYDYLIKLFTFRIGKTYRATHSQNACLRALAVAETDKEKVCGYGICSHLTVDTVYHNEAVPGAIKKTHLFNGLVHSIKEIHDKNLFTTEKDRVYSRQVLDLGYEMTPYLERVFVDDPALSKVSIPNMVDFFINQVQPDSEYRLGFRSFFALPSYLYWVILIMFFMSLILFALTVRRIREGQKGLPILFTAIFSFVLLTFVGTAIYGLFAKNIWVMWEVLSQFLFSPAMYFVGGALVILGGYIIFTFIMSKDKKNALPDLLVALFILSIGAYLLTLPTGLTIGNEQALHNLAIQNNVNLFTQGVNFIKTIRDPVGYNSLQEANSSGAGIRAIVLIYLLLILGGIIYFTFRKKR